MWPSSPRLPWPGRRRADAAISGSGRLLCERFFSRGRFSLFTCFSALTIFEFAVFGRRSFRRSDLAHHISALIINQNTDNIGDRKCHMLARNYRILRRWRRMPMRSFSALGQACRQGRHRKAVARTDQAARVADQRLRLLRAVSHPSGREPRHARRQAQPRRGVARGAAVFLARTRGAGVDRSPDAADGGVSDEVYAQARAEFSEKELTYLTFRDRFDQCLEQVRRRLSAGLRRRGRLRWAQRRHSSFERCDYKGVKPINSEMVGGQALPKSVKG